MDIQKTALQKIYFDLFGQNFTLSINRNTNFVCGIRTHLRLKRLWIGGHNVRKDWRALEGRE